MSSLVWKDIVAARRLLWLVLPLGAVQVATMSFVPGIYVFGAFAFAGLLAFGSIAVEEYERTELLWNSLPVTRAAFVTARYLTSLLGMLFGLGCSWAIAQTLQRMVVDTASGAAPELRLGTHAALLCVLMICAAVYLPLYFSAGAGRALLWFAAIAVAALLTTWLAAPPLGVVLAWAEPRAGLLLGLLCGAAVLATCVSHRIATRAYDARDL